MPGHIKTARRRKARARLPQYCGRCGATEGLTLDYIILRVYGGGHEFGNLQLLCGPCHRAKSKREVRYWHPAANRQAGERLRRKLAAAQVAAAVQFNGNAVAEATLNGFRAVSG